MKKIILLLIAAAFGGYLLFLAMPGLYFNRSLSYKSFTIRTRGPLPEKVEEVLDRAYEKISASGLYRPETRFNIYLPETRKEFLFFTPMQKGDFYRSNPYNGAIFLAAADFGADRVRTESGASEYHVLSIEIVAAAAREIIRSSLPALTYLVLADWKLRGYAERLSGGTGEFKPEDICSGKEDNEALLNYKAGLVIEAALREENMAFPELLGKNYSYDAMYKRQRVIYCGK